MTTEISQDRPIAPTPAGVEDAPRLPDQQEHWRAPARFGSVPVEEYPIGWDTHSQFQKHYPRVELPTQIVDRVSFGNNEAESNRLIWGDNLHVMRQIASNSIDLIYMDPPFFSGRQYNVMWGDANEMRSFNDIWEDGMTGYLIWLNARLYESKRLLKPTGSIYLHCDWHASHYIKVEMDKIFGYENFRDEVIWYQGYRGTPRKDRFQLEHQTILRFNKSERSTWNPIRGEYRDKSMARYNKIDEDGRRYALIKRRRSDGTVYYGRTYPKGKLQGDVIDVPTLAATDRERIGYPTQKPEALLERIIRSSSHIGDKVADFVMGGGHNMCCCPETRQTVYWLRSISRCGCRHRRKTQAASYHWRVWRFTAARLHRRALGNIRSRPIITTASLRFSQLHTSLLRCDSPY